MYVRLLFLLCAFANLIKADYSSEAKYIDLLPEDEKTDFLNRIARRIISEIRSGRGTQNTSVEISDERLNEHDEYVKKIMDEESQDMKNVRRTEDDSKRERDGDADFVGLKVKPIEKNDQRSQESLENVDLSASENKIRIKKGTPETNTERSKEHTDKADHTLSTVPVHLIYDEEGNLQSTMNTRKMDNPELTVNEKLGHNNEIQAHLENTEKMSNQQIIDLNNESKDIESKDQLNKVLKIENSTNSKEKEDDSIPKAQTVIYDFEPKQGDVIEYKNDTTEKSSEIVRAKQFELDEASNKWIEIHPKNATEEQLGISSVINNLREVTVNYEESTVATIADFKTDSTIKSTSTDNILNVSEFVLKTKDNLGGSNIQSEDTISSNKSVEHNVIVTENYLQPATPSNMYNTEFESKDSTVASTIMLRSVSNKGNNEGQDLFAKPKTILRLNQEDINNLNEQLRFNNHPYSSSPNDNRDMNSYQVFEVSRDKPFVQSKQINFGLDEAPYYVPVYNYAPNNAFYNPYNRFGPYNGNNPELIEIEDPYSKELSYEPSHFNSRSKYERAPSGTNNKNIKKNQNQRTFKHYPNDDEYEIDSKIPYQKFPVMKGKVINIHFNPNDYLDMDYYLGRSNDNSRQSSKHDVKKVKPFQFSHPQDTSGEFIDPISKQPHNMKNVISNIRTQMNSLKIGNKSRTMRSNNQKLEEKLRIVDKILANPIFRGLNNSLVVFIPKTRTKNIGNKDIRENNIAVDYYFSRMSSGEGPYLDDKVETEQEHKMDDDELTELLKKHILKSDTQNAQTQAVIEEQQLKIPLKIENVLKIDLAMKDNNVNVLLQKVKKPKPNDFEVLLNAYLSVLKDMIEYDNKGLLHYDWLGSAVDLQSALEKLITLSNIMHVRDDVHHYDRDLFRYVLFIFKTSLYSLVEAEGMKKEMKKASKRRSGMEKSIKSKMLPDIDILHQFAAWQEVRKYTKEMRDLNIEVYDYLLKQFEVFLSDLRDNLNELHEAIKGIASVTKYNKQRWYLDLKELYLTPLDRKVSLTLLLHLASTRLFGLIEESAKNGLEEDFMLYVQTHKMEVERTREEFVLVLRLLKELNRLKK